MGNAGHISGFEGCVAAESGYEWFYAGASMKHVVLRLCSRVVETADTIINHSTGA